MKTVKDVIEALGGSGPVSEAVGVSPNTVVYWSVRKRIPLDYWDPLMEWANSQGISAVSRDVLNAVCMPRRRRRSHGETGAVPQPSEAA